MSRHALILLDGRQIHLGFDRPLMEFYGSINDGEEWVYNTSFDDSVNSSDISQITEAIHDATEYAIPAFVLANVVYDHLRSTANRYVTYEQNTDGSYQVKEVAEGNHNADLIYGEKV